MNRTHRSLLSLSASLCCALLASCGTRQPVASRIAPPAAPPAATATTGGDEQNLPALASARASMKRDYERRAEGALHPAAASAISMHARRLNPQASAAYRGSEALARAIPAENPDAAMVDGMESLLQQTFSSEGADFDPCLSRDAKWLVYSSTQHRPSPDIYIKMVGSRTVTQLTADPASDVMPALSPDASRIAFCSNRAGSWGLFVMSSAGGQAVQLSTTDANDLHPTWSPDGRRLAFCRLGQVSGRWELWVMDVSQPQSAEFIGFGMFPRWCPASATGQDGTDKILFQRGRERGDFAFSLWTIDYKPGWASNPTEIVSTRDNAAISANWNPTGEWIVYSTVPADDARQANGATAPADLWITSINGSERVNLTGGRYTNLMPAWAADGRVYFVSDRGGQEQVWSISTEKALAAAGVKKPMNGETVAAPTE
ncbi:MAG: TolB family protein [Phycisphaerales bacterium]